jgi:hypothetical protein
MTRTIRILVQTTTPRTPDNWSVESLSLMSAHLAGLREGDTTFEVTARNHEAGPDGSDPVLATLDRSAFDELWLFAFDAGEDGLTSDECAAIGRFRQRGGGILSTRDHADMGSSLCTLGGMGAAHHFRHRNPESDPQRQEADDTETPSISWPNYHSGRNGDFQHITAVMPTHPLLARTQSEGTIEFLPSHPHEGAVGPPDGDPSAQVVACGRSLTTGRDFNLIVAFEDSRDEQGNPLGRGVAESSFHHFADYNWDTSRGAPSFVTEPEGDGMRREPRALQDIRQYVRNLAFWLAPSQAPH